MIVFNKLPNEYQQVEYIESSGTQYIDTGFIPDLDNGFKFEVKYGMPSVLTGRACILSNYSVSKHVSFEIPNNNYGVRGYFNSGAIDKYINNSNLTINSGSFEIYNRHYKLTQNEGVLTGTLSTATGISNGNIYMFVDRQKRFSTFTKHLKMYSCKIYDGTTLVRDYIPCYRKSDDVIGMYDTVEKTFYTNKGTGVFLKGQDIIALDISSIVLGVKEVKKLEDTDGNIWWQKPSSNIFDPTTATVIQAYFENGTPNITSNAGNRITYVACQPNTTYEIKKLLGKIFWVGCTVNEPAIGVATTSRQSGTTGTYDGTTTASTTFTTDSTANYLVVRYTSIWTDGSANESSIFNSIEIYEQ